MEKKTLWPSRLLGIVCVAVLAASCATTRKPPPTAGLPTKPPRAGVLAGTVTCDLKNYRVDLLGSDRAIKIEDLGSCEVAAGTYTLMSYLVRAKGSDGAEWSLVGGGGSPSPAINVKPHETVALKFGPPLKATLVATKKGERLYDFSVALKGRAGEVYSPRSILRAGQNPAPPGIEFRDSTGKVVATGSFRYG